MGGEQGIKNHAQFRAARMTSGIPVASKHTDVKIVLMLHLSLISMRVTLIHMICQTHIRPLYFVDAFLLDTLQERRKHQSLVEATVPQERRRWAILHYFDNLLHVSDLRRSSLWLR